MIAIKRVLQWKATNEIRGEANAASEKDKADVEGGGVVLLEVNKDGVEVVKQADSLIWDTLSLLERHWGFCSEKNEEQRC